MPTLSYEFNDKKNLAQKIQEFFGAVLPEHLRTPLSNFLQPNHTAIDPEDPALNRILENARVLLDNYFKQPDPTDTKATIDLILGELKLPTEVQEYRKRGQQFVGQLWETLTIDERERLVIAQTQEDLTSRYALPRGDEEDLFAAGTPNDILRAAIAARLEKWLKNIYERGDLAAIEAAYIQITMSTPPRADHPNREVIISQQVEYKEILQKEHEEKKLELSFLLMYPKMMISILVPNEQNKNGLCQFIYPYLQALNVLAEKKISDQMFSYVSEESELAMQEIKMFEAIRNEEVKQGLVEWIKYGRDQLQQFEHTVEDRELEEWRVGKEAWIMRHQDKMPEDEKKELETWRQTYAEIVKEKAKNKERRGELERVVLENYVHDASQNFLELYGDGKQSHEIIICVDGEFGCRLSKKEVPVIIDLLDPNNVKKGFEASLFLLALRVIDDIRPRISDPTERNIVAQQIAAALAHITQENRGYCSMGIFGAWFVDIFDGMLIKEASLFKKCSFIINTSAQNSQQKVGMTLTHQGKLAILNNDGAFEFCAAAATVEMSVPLENGILEVERRSVSVDAKGARLLRFMHRFFELRLSNASQQSVEELLSEVRILGQQIYRSEQVSGSADEPVILAQGASPKTLLDWQMAQAERNKTNKQFEKDILADFAHAVSSAVRANFPPLPSPPPSFMKNLWAKKHLILGIALAVTVFGALCVFCPPVAAAVAAGVGVSVGIVGWAGVGLTFLGLAGGLAASYTGLMQKMTTIRAWFDRYLTISIGERLGNTWKYFKERHPRLFPVVVPMVIPAPVAAPAVPGLSSTATTAASLAQPALVASPADLPEPAVGGGFFKKGSSSEIQQPGYFANFLSTFSCCWRKSSESNVAQSASAVGVGPPKITTVM
jgi:hypothetical protein